LTPASNRNFLVEAGALVVLIGAALGTTGSEAASLSNRDDRDHKISIVEGDATVDQVLKPQQALEGICAKGCVIRLNDNEDEEYQIEAADVVSIEDGYLYYDTPDAAPTPPPVPAPSPGVILRRRFLSQRKIDA
jgi:hypothetical protein